MRIKFSSLQLIKIILILQTLNFMVGVTLLNDNVIFKFSRDLILITLVVIAIYTTKLSLPRYFTPYFIFILILCAAFIGSMINAVSFNIAINTLRKYVFPILLLFVISGMKRISSAELKDFFKFILFFMSIIATWGVFQAWILKDAFLINLGYPTTYLPAYGENMLGYSFYFGGLGIQRVVSTFSNSNVCGLVLGVTLIFIVCLYPYIETRKIKYKDIAIFILFLAYILTFSRSNILAGIVVTLFFISSYIPQKKKILIGIIITLLICVVLYYTQGEDGLVYKIYGWFISSINFTDSSVAGRSGIWNAALLAVLENPFGVGFGKVGSLAKNNDVSIYYASENSYLAVGLDTGVAGLFVYLACFIILIDTFRKKIVFSKKNNNFLFRLNIAGYATLIYYLVVSFFSNHIYDMEAITFIYTYVGIALAYKE